MPVAAANTSSPKRLMRCRKLAVDKSSRLLWRLGMGFSKFIGNTIGDLVYKLRNQRVPRQLTLPATIAWIGAAFPFLTSLLLLIRLIRSFRCNVGFTNSGEPFLSIETRSRMGSCLS